MIKFKHSSNPYSSQIWFNIFFIFYIKSCLLRKSGWRQFEDAQVLTPFNLTVSGMYLVGILNSFDIFILIMYVSYSISHEVLLSSHSIEKIQITYISYKSQWNVHENNSIKNIYIVRIYISFHCMPKEAILNKTDAIKLG